MKRFSGDKSGKGSRPNKSSDKKTGYPRNTRPSRDGEAKPFKKFGDDNRREYRRPDERSGSDKPVRTPYNRDSNSERPKSSFSSYRRDGDPDRKSFKAPFDRDRKTFGRGEGDKDRKPFRRNDNEGATDRKPFSRGEGDRERKPYTRGEGDRERKPYARSENDSERKSYRRNEGDGERSERKPYNRGEGDRERKPYSRSESGEQSERKPFNRGEGDRERKPYGRSEGDAHRKPWRRSEGEGDHSERKPHNREGDRERKPYGRSEGDADRKPWRRSEGEGDRSERKPYDRGEGDRERKPYGRSEGDGERTERRPYNRGEGDRERKPFDRKEGESERKPYGRTNGDSERTPYRRSEDRDGGSSERKPYNRGEGDSGRKPYTRNEGDSERKPYGRNEGSSERKSYRRDEGDGERSERKPFNRGEGDRERKPFGRSSDDGERKPFRRSEGDSDRSESRPYKRSAGDERKPFRSNDNWDKKGDGEGAKFERSRFDERSKDYGKAAPKRAKLEPRDDGTTRLNKYIANAGVCSRREADTMIEAGAVTINGVVITELGTRVNPGDKVQVGNDTLNPEKKVYLVLNKPKGYITTVDDPQERDTVMKLVQDACKERIYPVGRLDRNTSGLLLFTNDGEIAKKLTHPSHKVRKMYQVEVNRTFAKSDMLRMTEGIELEDGLMTVDEIAYTGTGEDKKTLGVVIHSGKNRVVRRMFEALEYDVIKLDRVVFANLTKKDLPRGRWRFLHESEINMLKMI